MISSLAAAPAFERRSAKVTLTAVFTAMSLATNYALIGIPNVKIMDTLVFIAALFFGLRLGLGVAVSIWLVYGFVNPYGVDSFLMLVFLMIGECFYAMAGFALGKSFIIRESARGFADYLVQSFMFGTVGLVATFAYDALTNFGSWIFRTGSLYQDFIIGNIVGAPFSLIHEASNVFFFAIVAPAIVLGARSLHPRSSQRVA